MIERERVKMSPSEAVADAVMVAVFRQLDRHGGIDAWKDQKPDFGKAIPYDIEFITRLATKGGCREAADHVITYLKEKHGHMFRKLVVVEALSSMDYLLKNGWGWHDYFLVQGIDGVWYAGSPANYQNKMDGYEGEMLMILAAKNLGEVMAEITKLEGGLWPQAEVVEQIFDNGWLEEENSVPIIYNQAGDTLFRWYKRPKKKV